MQDEKVIETSLQNLISRISDMKISLQNFLLKLEHETLTWPQVLDNFALMSGQINTLNKVLKNDRMPMLRNLCILPILVSQDHDEELADFTENRIPVFNHEVVPDALRTKYEPEVEKEEQCLTMQASSMPLDDAQRQVAMLNDMLTSLFDLIQAAREDWDVESAVQQANLVPSEKDTNILIAAMTQGAGLRKRPESSASLNWCRVKDPPTSLGEASIQAALDEANIDYVSRTWNVNSNVFDWTEIVEFALNYSNIDTDFAIGAFIWNETFTQNIIKRLKAYSFPGKIIIGGPQVSYTKRYLERYYPDGDIFIRGYGENALVSYAKGMQIVKGLHKFGEPDLSLSANVNLDQLPSPFLNGIIPPQRFIRWETQRGCPFQCSFCQHREPDLFMKRKLFDRERIAQEIEWICTNRVIQDVAVLDPTFNSGSLYLNVLELLAEWNYSGKIAFQCRLEMCTDEFLEAVCRLNQSARVVLEFGVQTIHRDEQKLIQRFNNLKKAEKVMKRLNEEDVETELSLIFGLPEQTLASFISSVQWCQKVAPTKIMAFPLMLLRGTPLYEYKRDLGLVEATEIAHPAIERIQEDIPHVISSPSFTFDEWKKMADIAVTVNEVKY